MIPDAPPISINIDSYSVRRLNEDSTDELVVTIRSQEGTVYDLYLVGDVLRPAKKGDSFNHRAPLAVEFTEELAAYLGYALAE